MPVRLQAVPGTNTIYATFQASLPRWFADLSVLWPYWWSWKHRGLATQGEDDFGHGVSGGLWPSKSGFFSDPAIPCSLMLDQDRNGGGSFLYSPWIYGYGGNQCSKYIMGQCQDSSEVPLGGAIVKGFRTSDNLYIGYTETDDKGMYELRCPNTPTDQHYLVAYYGAGSLAGTTVNTLVPTWRDGTV